MSVHKTLRLYREAYTGHPREIWILAWLTFINRTGTMVLPFLSVYATTVLGFSLKEAGLIMASFGFGSLGGSYFGGKLSDYFGGRLVIVGSLLMGGAMFISLQLAASLESLMALIFLAALFGAFSGIFGTAVSATSNNLSTGPVIVLIAAVFVAISFVFSPGRGMLFKEIRYRKNRNDLQLHKTLYFMYGIAKTHEDISHPHTIKILNNFQGYTKNSLKELEDREYIDLEGTMWSLTEKGYEKAINLYNHQENLND